MLPRAERFGAHGCVEATALKDEVPQADGRKDGFAVAGGGQGGGVEICLEGAAVGEEDGFLWYGDDALAQGVAVYAYEGGVVDSCVVVCGGA